MRKMICENRSLVSCRGLFGQELDCYHRIKHECIPECELSCFSDSICREVDEPGKADRALVAQQQGKL